MSAPVRVLWLAKGLGRGGAEMLLVALAHAMDRTAVEVEVAYVLPHKDALVANLEAEGVRVHLLGDGSTGSWVGALRRLLRLGQYDVVHSHAPVVGAAARVLADQDVVLVHTEHNVWGRYRRATRWANSVTLSRNAKVWAVSEGVGQSIRPWSLLGRRPPVEVMLHGVDPSLVRHGPEARELARRKLDLEDGVLTVGTVGNLTPKKDHPSLLRAFADLRRHHPDARLVIVGTGPREQHLRALARDLRLGQAVHFTGIRDDVQELLPGFDLFVLSSLHEGLSIALVEALAAGLPIVATRVGGIPEVVTHGVEGLLVPASDSRALANAMSLLASDEGLRRRCAEAAPLRGAEFGIQAAADTLSREYRQLAAAGRATARAS